MDKKQLKQSIDLYKQRIEQDRTGYEQDRSERRERAAYYQSWTADRLRSMTEEDLYEYLAKLWAMLIWGNKKYAVDKLIEGNGFEKLRTELATLVWSDDPIEARWDRFRKRIKGMGPAMMSEILCHVHPADFILWNRRAYVGLHKLRVPNLPRYDYQLNGQRYRELSSVGQQIAAEMRNAGIVDANLLTVDYLIWHELQGDENLSQLHKKPVPDAPEVEAEAADQETSEFIHNEVRDKLADIGRWLGFTTQTERKVADGSKVDTVWEATIGNMGRVIYVFEVQTKGSLDSLILNLLKFLNNPAVQGVVAVSDTVQIERIKRHAAGVAGLREKLRYWDYKAVLQVHDALEAVNESINSLGLVPQGF